MVLRFTMAEPRFLVNNCTSSPILAIEKKESQEEMEPTWLSGIDVDDNEQPTRDDLISRRKAELLEPFKKSYLCNYSFPQVTKFRISYKDEQPEVSLQQWRCLKPHLRRKRFAPLIALGLL